MIGETLANAIAGAIPDHEDRVHRALLRHGLRTVYGWPLWQELCLGPAFWSVAAMLAASEMTSDVLRALLKSAGGWVPINGAHYDVLRSEPGVPFRRVTVPVPSPHAAPHHLLGLPVPHQLGWSLPSQAGDAR